jgi:mannose-6-phosphate isomerase
LSEVLESNPSLIGGKVAQKFGKGQLPFLFKVLSIHKALSIQAHPDKELAKQLHARDPKNYKGISAKHAISYL